jgi:hypothetical protein
MNVTAFITFNLIHSKSDLCFIVGLFVVLSFVPSAILMHVAYHIGLRSCSTLSQILFDVHIFATHVVFGFTYYDSRFAMLCVLSMLV